jgi:hypothetical protein
MTWDEIKKELRSTGNILSKEESDKWDKIHKNNKLENESDLAAMTPEQREAYLEAAHQINSW